jgi:predicted dehydrogenase
MKSDKPINIGLIGCGGFGIFCINAIMEMQEAELIAIVDTDVDLLEKTARKFKVKAFRDPYRLSQLPEIELVHIVTPPNSHYTLARYFLEQGKNVLCEKPLALSLEDGTQLIELSSQMNRIIPVNFILRYTPIVDLVKKIIDLELLGKPIRAYFENYATDVSLPEGHWFWDKEKSGGIFVEHGVHFFDLYHYWFGDLEILWANSVKRAVTAQEDRVMAVLISESDVIIHHYHGFDQPATLDRQIHKIIFEQGEILIEGWIPTILKIDGLVNGRQVSGLRQIFADSDIQFQRFAELSHQTILARGKTIEIEGRIRIDYQSQLSKLDLYTHAIQELIRDQQTYIRKPAHQRVITEKNGLTALEYALEARNING